MADECARLQRESELRSTLGTVPARNKFPWAGLNMNLFLSVLAICPTTVDLAIFLVATLSTVENLSSVESSTMLSFQSMSKMKMTRNAAASWNSTTQSVVGL